MPAPAGSSSPALLSAFEDPAWLSGWPTAASENDRGVRPIRINAQTRWDPAQADTALRQAEQGDMRGVALMLDAMRRDGLINGIMGVRTSGMLRCPVKFSGDPWLVEQLRGRDPVYDRSGALVDPGTPGLFWDMFPESEQSAIVFDGIMAGIGLGELVPRPGKPPRLRHLPLHFLKYRFEADFWYFNSGASGISWAITTDTDEPPVAMDPPLPSDEPGRFVVYTPYGRERVWIKGMWWPCSLPFIQRQNVVFDGLRWQQNLADPLKVATAQAGADEKHRTWLESFIRNMWRRAGGLVSPPGYQMELVESNGRGYEIYQQAYDQAGGDILVTLTGSKAGAGSEGGQGFSNAPEFSKIDASKTGMVAATWETTLHEQGIRPWTKSIGQERERAPWARFDVRSPEQRAADARALGELAAGVDKIDVTLARRGRRLDLDAYLEETGQSLPSQPLPADGAAATSKIDLAPTDLAKIVRVNEGRSGAGGLGPLALPDGTPDPDGNLTITECAAKHSGTVAEAAEADNAGKGGNVAPMRRAA